MKAMVLTGHGGPEVLELRDVPEPELGPEQILVRVFCTALNRTDLLQRRGGYPEPGAQGTHEILGLEFAGTVEAVGRRVTRWKAGDRVCGLLPGGGYAEFVTTHERMAMPVPSNLSWEEAAAIPEVFLTAFDALFYRVRLRVGERVLIHAGGSGVGTAAIQMARSVGAQVFATVGSGEKAERVRQLGAQPINYREQDFAQVIRDATGGRGVHAVLDFVGGPYLERNLQVLCVRGRMVEIGLLGGRKAEIDLGLLLNKRITLVGTVLRSRPIEEKIALTQAFVEQVLPLIASGHIKPVVDTVFPLDQAAQAHMYMEANKNFGKIILRVASEDLRKGQTQ